MKVEIKGRIKHYSMRLNDLIWSGKNYYPLLNAIIANYIQLLINVRETQTKISLSTFSGLLYHTCRSWKTFAGLHTTHVAVEWKSRSKPVCKIKQVYSIFYCLPAVKPSIICRKNRLLSLNYQKCKIKTLDKFHQSEPTNEERKTI